MPTYLNTTNVGLDAVSSFGDGYTINLKWFRAYPVVSTNKIAYHIYYSTVKEQVFSDGIKYVSIDGSLEANIIDLTPGQLYFFSIRPVEYNPSFFDLNDLPIAYDNLRVYPQSILRSNITATDLIIPLVDVSDFTAPGVVQVGVELIRFTSIDTLNNNLIVPPSIPGEPVTLVDQGPPDGYFSKYTSNVGDGYITNLTAVSGSGAPTEDWNVVCSFVQRDGYNIPIPGTAAFIATGTISGTIRDGYGDPIYWRANGPIVSNGILSFAIVDDGYTFEPGDGFLIKVLGATQDTPGGRGYDFTIPRLHNIDGYDGYNYWSPVVKSFTIGEDNLWDRIFLCQSRFEYPHYAYTNDDGYRQVVKDLLSTDLSAADADNVDFPTYDYSGYHRTDPVQLLTGVCVGSYIGGEQGCIDKYGNFNIVRGMSLQDQNSQREEILLNITGRPAVLLQRQQTGIQCACYQASSEYPDDRCPLCYGTKFVFGYTQYFNPRRSDGRILVRPGPTEENLKMYEAGLESEFPLELWTLTVPTIKTRDVLIMFDQDGNEEFRYEVMGVTRNNTIVSLNGGQKLRVQRIRKYDPAYQIRAIKDTSMFPSQLNTNIGMASGIPPHTHTIVVNEGITMLSQVNQTTGVSQGHNHPIVNGEVIPVLGHTHTIILP